MVNPEHLSRSLVTVLSNPSFISIATNGNYGQKDIVLMSSSIHLSI